MDGIWFTSSSGSLEGKPKLSWNMWSRKSNSGKCIIWNISLKLQATSFKLFSIPPAAWVTWPSNFLPGLLLIYLLCFFFLVLMYFFIFVSFSLPTSVVLINLTYVYKLYIPIICWICVVNDFFESIIKFFINKWYELASLIIWPEATVFVDRSTHKIYIRQILTCFLFGWFSAIYFFSSCVFICSVDPLIQICLTRKSTHVKTRRSWAMLRVCGQY